MNGSLATEWGSVRDSLSPAIVLQSVTFQFGRSGQSQPAAGWDCFIDTGATLSAIPMSAVKDAGATPDFFKSIRGYNGIRTNEPGYYVSIKIPGFENSPLLQAITIPDDSLLLGRDYLTAMKLCLRADWMSSTYRICRMGWFRRCAMKIAAL